MIVTDLFDSHFLPAREPSAKLMIVLHGKGDSLKPFKKFDQELRLPGFNYLLLNAPKRFLDGYSWYGDPPFQKQGVLRIREKMFRLLDQIESKAGSPKIFSCSAFSQGCLVSSDVALYYPKRLGGVVGISGYFQFYPRWRNEVSRTANQTPWLLTHGTQDATLPIEETKFGVKKLRTLGLKIKWVESEKDHVFEDSGVSPDPDMDPGRAINCSAAVAVFRSSAVSGN